MTSDRNIAVFLLLDEQFETTREFCFSNSRRQDKSNLALTIDFAIHRQRWKRIHLYSEFYFRSVYLFLDIHKYLYLYLYISVCCYSPFFDVFVVFNSTPRRHIFLLLFHSLGWTAIDIWLLTAKMLNFIFCKWSFSSSILGLFSMLWCLWLLFEFQYWSSR